MVVLYVIMFVVQWKIIAKKRYMIQLQNDIFHKTTMQHKIWNTIFYQNQNVTKIILISSLHLFFLDFSYFYLCLNGKSMKKDDHNVALHWKIDSRQVGFLQN